MKCGKRFMQAFEERKKNKGGRTYCSRDQNQADSSSCTIFKTSAAVFYHI